MRSRRFVSNERGPTEEGSDEETDGGMCVEDTEGTDGGIPNSKVTTVAADRWAQLTMKVVRWRLSPRRLAVGTVTLLLVVWSTLFFLHTFHPDYILPSTRLSVVPLSDFFWLDWVAGDYFQPRRTVVSPVPGFQLLPSRGCQESSFLLVLVASPSKDFASRRLIRDTWKHAVQNNQWPGARLSVSVEVFFVLGISSSYVSNYLENLKSQLKAEAKEFDDIIAGDFTDSYRNLTRKTLTGLNWARQHCAQTEFVMKLDQDTLVDFPRLTNFLFRHRYELRNAVIGKLYFNSKRLDRGKWRVLPEEYPLSLYPTFAGGPCYILSTDVVGAIVNVSQYVPFFVMEDVQVTGILARVLGVRRLYMQQLQNWKADSLCVLLDRDKYMVSMTNLTPEEMRQVWAMLQAGRCSSTPQEHNPHML